MNETYTGNAISDKIIIAFICTKKNNNYILHITGIPAGNYKPSFQYDKKYTKINTDIKELIISELKDISSSLKLNYNDFVITYNF